MATRDRKNRLEGALPRLSDYMKKWAEELPDHRGIHLPGQTGNLP